MVTVAYPRLVAVTASATALAEGPTDALYIGTTGNVTVTLQGGNSVTFAAVAGNIVPFKVTHVTAGTGVVACYY